MLKYFITFFYHASILNNILWGNFFLIIFVITMHTTMLEFKSVNAQKGSEIVIKNTNVTEGQVRS
jgi:hypothetical protein